jgi:hypothetical protein
VSLLPPTHTTAIGLFLALTFSLYTLSQCELALSRILQHSQKIVE